MKGRLEGFSDESFAFAIKLLVQDLKQQVTGTGTLLEGTVHPTAYVLRPCDEFHNDTENVGEPPITCSIAFDE